MLSQIQRLLSTARSPCATQVEGETRIANLMLLFILFTNSDSFESKKQNGVDTIWDLASVCSVKFNHALLSMLLYCQTLADKAPNFRDAPTLLAEDLWLVSHILFFAPSKPWNELLIHHPRVFSALERWHAGSRKETKHLKTRRVFWVRREKNRLEDNVYFKRSFEISLNLIKVDFLN